MPVPAAGWAVLAVTGILLIAVWARVAERLARERLDDRLDGWRFATDDGPTREPARRVADRERPRSMFGRRRDGPATARARLGEAAAVMASALRAGASLPQALEVAADDVGPPLALELEQVLARQRVGVSLHRALAEFADRQGTAESAHLVTVLDVGRHVGPGLPALLDEVAAAIRERVGAEREVAALTAQARLSGKVLSLLPIGFFLFVLLTSRQEVLSVLGTPSGAAAAATGLALQVTGAWWVRRLVRIEV